MFSCLCIVRKKRLLSIVPHAKMKFCAAIRTFLPPGTTAITVFATLNSKLISHTDAFRTTVGFRLFDSSALKSATKLGCLSQWVKYRSTFKFFDCSSPNFFLYSRSLKGDIPNAP